MRRAEEVVVVPTMNSSRRRRRSSSRKRVTIQETVVQRPRQRSKSRSRRNNAMLVRQPMIPAMEKLSLSEPKRSYGQSMKVQESSRRTPTLENYMKQNVRGIGLAGRTYPGCAWMTKALDPCHPTTAVMGIPDRICINTVAPDFEEVFMVNNLSAASGAGVIADTGSTVTLVPTLDWNMLMVQDFSSACVFAMIYQGSVENPTYAQCFSHSLKGIRQIVGSESNLNGIAKSRLSYAGVTAEFTGSDLSNQGRLVVAQAPSEWSTTNTKESLKIPAYVPPAATTADVTSEYYYRTWVLGTPNVDSDKPSLSRLQTFASNLMQVSVRAVSMAAKEGFYAPVYLNDPAFLFKEHKYTVTGNLTTGVDGQHQLYVNPFYTAGRGSYAVPGTGVGGTIERVADGYDAHCVISHWQGLDPKASIQFTYRYGLECNPEPGGILSAFAKPSPDFDEQAMDGYNHLRIKMDDAYPASYNLMDKLWNVIKLIAKSTIPHLMGAVPIVGGILQNLVTNAMKSYV